MAVKKVDKTRKSVTLTPEAEGISIVVSVLQRYYIVDRDRILKGAAAFFELKVTKE